MIGEAKREGWLNKTYNFLNIRLEGFNKKPFLIRDIESVCNKHDIRLVPNNELKEDGCATCFIENGIIKKVIFYRPQNSIAKQTLTLAHELSHHLCGHCEHHNVPKKYTSTPYFDSPIEYEAQAIGLILMLPTKLVLATQNYDEIRKDYTTSIHIAEILRQYDPCAPLDWIFETACTRAKILHYYGK